MADGWGDLLGDKGSAVWIAKRALQRILSAYDRGTDESSKLTKAVVDYGGSDVEKLIPIFRQIGKHRSKKLPK